MIDHTVGAVLAGGESRRMGTPKADLEYLGVSFLDHAVANLSLVVADVVVVGDTYSGPLPATPDAVGSAGPLGGVLGALRYAAPRPVAVLAVDLPLVSIALLSRLIEPVVGDGELRMASDGERIQPLCAVWGQGLADPISSYLEGGGRSVLRFVDSVERLELIRADPQILTNINTPQDYAMLHRVGDR